MDAEETAGRQTLAARLEARLPATTEQRLRWGAVVLAGLGIGGLFTELILKRHWSNELQLIAFVAVGVVALAFVLVVRSRSRRTVLLARGVALAGVVMGGVGMVIHVRENYLAAPLDYHFTESWPTTPEVVRWFLAATDTVGPAPALVPGAISFMALMLLLGTLGHPALHRVAESRAVGSEAPAGGHAALPVGSAASSASAASSTGHPPGPGHQPGGAAGHTQGAGVRLD